LVTLLGRCDRVEEISVASKAIETGELVFFSLRLMFHPILSSRSVARVLGAVLNTAFEPTRRAVAENDLGMIRWLVCLALTERSLNLSAKQFAGETIRGFESRPIRKSSSFLWSPGLIPACL
jgi:hypothetical protein